MRQPRISGNQLASILIITGLVVMSWPVITWAYGQYWQARLAQSFADEVAEKQLTAATVTASVPAPRKEKAKPTRRPKAKRPAPRNGEALARLRIAKIGLNAIVVEGADRFSLRQGPGHLPQTGQPGEDRNCAIAAHRDGWFERLHEVRQGDTVSVESPDAVYKYVVAEKRTVTPDRGDLLNRGPKPLLTLITCTGPGYPHSRYRLLVFCKLKNVYPR